MISLYRGELDACQLACVSSNTMLLLSHEREHCFDSSR